MTELRLKSEVKGDCYFEFVMRNAELDLQTP